MNNVWGQVLILIGLCSVTLLMADAWFTWQWGVRSCLWTLLAYSAGWWWGRWRARK